MRSSFRSVARILRAVKRRVALYAEPLARLEAMKIGDVIVLAATEREAVKMRPTIKRGARNLSFVVRCSVERDGLRVERTE